MRILDYLRDRVLAYIFWCICLIVTIIFLRAFKVQIQAILVVTVIDIMAVTFHEIWNLSRKKRFYDCLEESVTGLDKKYLLSEMLPEPGFYEGRIIYDALYQGDKSMTENVNEYRQQTSDFREYIEMWVHEAKIPVSAVRLMNHNSPGGTQDKMNVQLKRIDDCIDNVLFYARSESAEKDYIINESSLKKIFSNVAVRNREALQLIGGEIQAGDLDVRVLTDSKWLEFILGQLMANSIKYAPKDRPLTICVYAEENDKETILHFRDNGIGIPETDLPYIFEKSFTGQNGRSEAKSTGMGLYIVKTLCDRLGHGINVSSTKNKYTEFVILFAKHDFYKMN